MLTLIRQRNFAPLWIAALVSTIGDWTLLVGLPIYIYLLTRSVLATGLMMVAGGVPRILLGPVAGVLADRWNPQRTVVIGHFFLTAIVALLLFVRTPGMVWIVYLQSALVACVQQFLAPAGAKFVPSVVKEEQFVAMNSVLDLCSNIGRLTGPVIGGVIATRYGLPGMVLVDAASFIVAAVLIGSVVVPPGSSQRAPAVAAAAPAASDVGALARGWREWVAALGVIRQDPSLRALIIALGISAVGEGVFGPLFPVFVAQVLHGGAGQIGSLMTAQAVGSMIGGIVVGRLGSRALARGAIGGASVVYGCICAAFFNLPRFHPSFTLELALFALAGVSVMGVGTAFAAIAQLRSPPVYRGRIRSVMGSMASLLGLGGTIIALVATRRGGVATVLSLQAACYVAVGVVVVTLLPRGLPIARPVPPAQT